MNQTVETIQLKGQALLDDYREAAVTLYGEDVAERGTYHQNKGWYYVGVHSSLPLARRAWEVQVMANTLRYRATHPLG